MGQIFLVVMKMFPLSNDLWRRRPTESVILNGNLLFHLDTSPCFSLPPIYQRIAGINWNYGLIHHFDTECLLRLCRREAQLAGILIVCDNQVGLDNIAFRRCFTSIFKKLKERIALLAIDCSGIIFVSKPPTIFSETLKSLQCKIQYAT